MKQKIDRNFSYDIMRIIACFCVIVNHSIGIYDQWGKISTIKWLLADAMFCFCKTAVPIFLLLSGALLLKREESYRDWLKKRILHIVIIIVCWAIIYRGLPQIISLDKFSFIEIFNILILTIKNSISTLPSWHMWYLYALLGMYFMLPFLRKMVKNMNKRDSAVFIIIWLCFSGVIPYYNSIFAESPIRLNANFYLGLFSGYLALYIIGYIIEMIDINKKNMIIAVMIFGISLFIHVAVTYVKSVEAQMSVRTFDSALVLPVMLTSSSMFFLARCFEEYKGKYIEKLTGFVAEIGKCTLGVYLIHPLILRLMYSNDLFIKLFPNWTLSLYQTFLVQLLAFCFSTAIIWIMRKIPVVRKIV